MRNFKIAAGEGRTIAERAEPITDAVLPVARAASSHWLGGIILAGLAMLGLVFPMI
jgi:hypothetical protein